MKKFPKINFQFFSDYKFMQNVLVLLAVAGFIGHLLFYFVLTSFTPYWESLLLRVIVAFLFLSLLILPRKKPFNIFHKIYYELIYLMVFPAFFLICLYFNDLNVYWAMSVVFAAVLYGYLSNPPVAIIAYPISIILTLYLLNLYNGAMYDNSAVLIIQFPAYFIVILMGLIQSFIRRTNNRINSEKNRSDSLLRNILPVAIIEKLKEREGTIAERCDNTSILFADIVDFTKMAENINPEKLLDFLNEIFTIFDGLTEKYEVEKIKTIGDAYMVVCGTPIPNRRHAEVVAAMALEMMNQIEKYNRLHKTSISIRIGINSGPVIAGVIGKKKFAYDIWGDTVNTASRMESNGLPGKIHISEATYELISNRFTTTTRPSMDIKGKGIMNTFFLEGKIEQKF